MNDDHIQLNYFLVKVFNEILQIEESCLKIDEFKNLSIREMHVIEAVCTANEEGLNNRASAIAQAQRITAGTLTTAVILLEKKGYLIRKQDTLDKRIVRLYASEKGKRANKVHQDFHHEMVKNVMQTLKQDEINSLMKGLKSLEAFFDQNKKLI